MSELTKAQRDILERTPSDLTGVLGGFFHPSADHRELERRGLLEMDGYGSHGGGFVCRYRRAPVGSEATVARADEEYMMKPKTVSAATAGGEA